MYNRETKTQPLPLSWLLWNGRLSRNFPVTEEKQAFHFFLVLCVEVWLLHGKSVISMHVMAGGREAMLIQIRPQDGCGQHLVVLPWPPHQRSGFPGHLVAGPAEGEWKSALRPASSPCFPQLFCSVPLSATFYLMAQTPLHFHFYFTPKTMSPQETCSQFYT